MSQRTSSGFEEEANASIPGNDKQAYSAGSFAPCLFSKEWKHSILNADADMRLGIPRKVAGRVLTK